MNPNRHTIDEDTASRLLQGIVHPDDAPPGYGAVADLLSSAAKLPVTPVDENVAAATVSAMVEVIRDATPAPETSRRKSMLGKLLAGKAVAATAVAVLGLTATGAAAATGSLPDQAQAVVSDAAGHVGVNIPHPNHGKSKNHRQDGAHKPDTGDEAPAGDDNSGNSGEEPTKGMSGVVRGIKAGRAANSGPLGQEVCKIASDGKCHSGDENKGKGGDDTDPPSGSGENKGRGDENNGDHGKPAVTPPTTPANPDTPNGGIDTGADNSGRELPSGGKPDSDS